MKWGHVIHTRVVDKNNTTWWRHQMEIFSALLAICAGNSSVFGEFPAQRPVTRSFDVFFDLCPINDWVNNRVADDLRCSRAHYDVTVMQTVQILKHVSFRYLRNTEKPIRMFPNTKDLLITHRSVHLIITRIKIISLKLELNVRCEQRTVC